MIDQWFFKVHRDCQQMCGVAPGWPVLSAMCQLSTLSLNCIRGYVGYQNSRIYLQEKYSKLIEETLLGYGEEQLTLVGAEA